MKITETALQTKRLDCKQPLYPQSGCQGLKYGTHEYKIQGLRERKIKEKYSFCSLTLKTKRTSSLLKK